MQLIQLLIQRRSFGRKTDAEALGGEVEALEKAIATLRNNLDAEVERHDTERRRFESRIAELEGQIAKSNNGIVRTKRRTGVCANSATD